MAGLLGWPALPVAVSGSLARSPADSGESPALLVGMAAQYAALHQVLFSDYRMWG
jgi:hypothetical protein